MKRKQSQPQNDSNILPQPFYQELLYIMGLTEVKQGSKKLIEREAENKRKSGSLLENTITQLMTLSKLFNLENSQEYGGNEEEKLFNISLELVITWLNRILFLKFLESQLINYHQENQKYGFLNLRKIANYQELNNLFFQVLNCKIEERSLEIQEKFAYLPYLNSGLFEISKLEKRTVVISNLIEQKLSLFNQTVLKDNNANKPRGEINSLQYLFEFLNSYDFGNPPQPPLIREAKKEIFDDNKKLINASVLGLIFEKINGYKDGSFFTPGFITMYMCRQTIRRAVLEKFKEMKGWNCENIEALFNKIEDKKEANTIINSLKICDPAVGSGHFLVSALNEIIALKSELKILLDRQGKTLRDYQIEVIDDELIVTDDDGELFQYNPKNQESQRIQEALFHEKQTIIENCLFGVDINPNSVKICRLRLWIELLKNAYYLPSPLTPLPLGEGKFLQTLPNIDINIKCGNSLINRFQLNTDLRQALKKNKLTIDVYKNAVKTYHNSKDKQEKREIENLISQIKANFTNTINSVDFRLNKLRQAEGELNNLLNQTSLFEETKTEKKARESKQKKLEKEINLLTAEIEDLKSNRIYNHAFEWRFEFPEVLNDDGDFVGFDVVIGNPPYGVSITKKERDYLIINQGKVPDFEIYYWFINKANSLLKNSGKLSYIIPNSILFNVFAQNYRIELFTKWHFDEILDCTNINIFLEATVKNVIISLAKSKNSKSLNYRQTDKVKNFQELINRELLPISKDLVMANNQNWGLLFKLPQNIISLITQIKLNSQPLINFFPETSQGLIAYDKYKNQSNEVIKNRIYHSPEKLNNNYKFWLYGEDVIKYHVKWNGKEYINYCEQIANPREPKYFIGKRILVREITNPSIFAALTTEELYNDPAIIIILDNPQENLSIECLLGILNSKFATFYHFNSSPKATKGVFPKILVYDINNFPLPKSINKDLESFISNKVTQILDLKQANSNTDTSELEREIDLLVYELYELTQEEIAILEKDN